VPQLPAENYEETGEFVLVEASKNMKNLEFYQLTQGNRKRNIKTD